MKDKKGTHIINDLKFLIFFMASKKRKKNPKGFGF